MKIFREMCISRAVKKPIMAQSWRNGKDTRNDLANREVREDTHFHRLFRRDTLYTLAKNE